LKAVEQEPDERLLVEAAQQDPARFAQLYEHNFDRVYAFVARRVGQREEAEDITAEVFHQALAGLGRFEWRGVPFVAWLFGISARLIAHRFQLAARDPRIATDDLEEAGREDDTERNAIFLQLVGTLPADQRRVIIARFVEQKSIRDLAQELQRTEGAVKQLQFRALQSLRTLVRSSHD
jgi:RNA polymerase sigma-70 factor, ECF subfamily